MIEIIAQVDHEAIDLVLAERLAGGRAVSLLTLAFAVKTTRGVAVEIATEVGGIPGANDVFSKFDTLVSSLAGALSGKSGGRR